MRRRHISPKEQVSKKEQARQQSLAAIEQLLFSRRQTAKALGDISIATVIRMENSGLLDKVRLAGSSSNGAVFHRAAQVHALALGGER